MTGRAGFTARTSGTKRATTSSRSSSARASRAADVAFLVPTFTYQVYGCFVRPGPRRGNRSARCSLGRAAETPDMNPQFGLSIYNHHADGSGVAIDPSIAPMLDTRPRQISADGSRSPTAPAPGASSPTAISCNSSHGLASAPDVHDRSRPARRGRRPRSRRIASVIAGTASGVSLRADDAGARGFSRGGGRLIYLGGNGFYWRAEPSEDQRRTRSRFAAPKAASVSGRPIRARAITRSAAAMAGCGGASAARRTSWSATAFPRRAGISAFPIASPRHPRSARRAS